ncbi:protein-L-isoaspartate O-methyltransferase [Patescibacteria group bacterium]|nr:protein-L-isoaspartate O-methyltransferase [Patescibacteria group bacterium]
MEELIQNLVDRGILKTPAIIRAFSEINREDFVPLDMKQIASIDSALPIGSGQTISQPLVVAFMLEELEPKKGQHILDIGAGSGWTTALLAHIVGNSGKVVGIEIIPELAEFGKNNVGKYSFIEKGIAIFISQDGSAGYLSEAPFDNILISASLQEKRISESWKDQLKEGGKIVTPIKESIWVFTKTSRGEFEEKEYPGFVFVPFVRQ